MIPYYLKYVGKKKNNDMKNAGRLTFKLLRMHQTEGVESGVRISGKSRPKIGRAGKMH